MDEQRTYDGAEAEDGQLLSSLRAAVETELVEAVVLGVDVQARPAAEIRVLGDDLLSDDLVLDIRCEPAEIELRPRVLPESGVAEAPRGASSDLLFLVNRARYRVGGIAAVSAEPPSVGELAELTYRSGRVDLPGMVRVVLDMAAR
jgi:hypothetical protein